MFLSNQPLPAHYGKRPLSHSTQSGPLASRRRARERCDAGKRPIRTPGGARAALSAQLLAWHLSACWGRSARELLELRRARRRCTRAPIGRSARSLALAGGLGLLVVVVLIIIIIIINNQ